MNGEQGIKYQGRICGGGEIIILKGIFDFFLPQLILN
jgi:hypothetical protein